jgi:Tol biopolymer transport system component
MRPVTSLETVGLLANWFTRARRLVPSLLPAVIATMMGAGCGTGDDMVEPPALGALIVTITTTGADPDPDGYGLRVDQASDRVVGVNEATTFEELPVGSHEVALSGLAGNCQINGDNPRTITVEAGVTTQLAFAVSCSGLTATVIITTTTTGFLADPDGYLVTADAGAERPLGTQGSITLSGLAPGPHSFTLGGVATNCSVSGDNPVVLTLQAGTTTTLAFSVACEGQADRGDLLFTGSAGNTSHIYQLRPDGTTTDLTPNAQADEGSWSPDGSQIVFTSVRSGTLGIYAMDADGQNIVHLTNNGETSPDWSPDGTRIVFWPYVTIGFGEITVMNADGSDVHVLGNGSHPAWSPDGTRIAFERAEQNACVFDICALNIYTMAVNGTDLRKLTSNTQPFAYAAAPAWSPDGTRIAYLAGGLSGGPTLQLITAAGGFVRSLGPVRSAPVWSPAGDAIAVAQPAGGSSTHIVALPVAGGPGVTLVTRAGMNIPTSWR